MDYRERWLTNVGVRRRDGIAVQKDTCDIKPVAINLIMQVIHVSTEEEKVLCTA